jgi:hypothetical protein
MNQLDEIDRIAADERAGTCTVAETCWRIFCLIDGANLERVVGRLPADLRDEFTAWARRSYDNDRPVSGFVSIRGDHERFEEALAAVRAWLAQAG